MARGYPTTDDVKIRLLELIDSGASINKAAKEVGIGYATAWKIKDEFYGKDVRSMDAIIAGDKKNGTLKATGPSHFVGTCLTKSGKMKTRHFNVPNSKQAIAEWEKWKDSINRNANTCPKKQEEKETFVATNNNSQILQATNNSQILQATNKPVPKSASVKYIYILAVGEPKLASFFVDENQARQAMEAANKALEFAGVDIRYSVVEVEREK